MNEFAMFHASSAVSSADDSDNEFEPYIYSSRVCESLLRNSSEVNLKSKYFKNSPDEFGKLVLVIRNKFVVN